MSLTKEEYQGIISETLRQLGGQNRLTMMIGAKNYTYSKSKLMFKIGRNSKKINYVTIELNFATDSYDLHFMQLWNGDIKQDIVVRDVYCDMLKDTMEENTGMYLSL